MTSEASTLTSNLESATINTNMVVKSGRVINIRFLATSVAQPAMGNIATLPQNYRPQGVRGIMGYILYNN